MKLLILKRKRFSHPRGKYEDSKPSVRPVAFRLRRRRLKRTELPNMAKPSLKAHEALLVNTSRYLPPYLNMIQRTQQLTYITLHISRVLQCANEILIST